MFIPKADYTRILEVLPILCVDCVIIHDARCLLLKRLQEPAKGQYWFPGGRVFKGEQIKDAALRKAREEVSLECAFEGTLSIEETLFTQQGDMPFDLHTVNVCCRLSVQNLDTFTLDPSHDGCAWVDANQAGLLGLHPAVLAPLVKCLEISHDQ